MAFERSTPEVIWALSLVTILSGCEINNFAGQSAKSVCYNLVAMFDLFRFWLGAVLRGFRTRRSLMHENLALRQQLAVFKRQQPRPRLGVVDKLFWVVARRFWAHWEKALLIAYGKKTHLRFQGMGVYPTEASCRFPLIVLQQTTQSFLATHNSVIPARPSIRQ